jgi:hypothetical protein
MQANEFSSEDLSIEEGYNNHECMMMFLMNGTLSIKILTSGITIVIINSHHFVVAEIVYKNFIKRFIKYL